LIRDSLAAGLWHGCMHACSRLTSRHDAMSRFSSWLDGAKERNTKGATLEGHTDEPPLQEDAKEGKYLVDNEQISAELRAARKGIRYYLAACFKEFGEEIELARFGSVVTGVPCSNGWLRVGERYLPMLVDGVPVLRPIRFEEADDSPTEPTESENIFPPGTGSLYEVVFDRVLIRDDPDTSAGLVGYRTKGQIVELFELNEKRTWGLCFEVKHQRLGWMMLTHPRFGPLLRPINGIAMAVRQNNTSGLKTRIKEGRDVDKWDEGRSPLMMAAERGYLECCVLLLKARADPWGAPDVANSNATRALVQGLGSKDCNKKHLEKAMALLPAHVKPLAESVFVDAAKALEARKCADIPDPASPEARGDAFEVVRDEVWIYNKPSTGGDCVSSRERGQVVELFEHDESRCWRRTAMGTGEVGTLASDPKGSGWMQLETESGEILLMPLAPI